MNGFKHLFSRRSFDLKKNLSAYTFYRTPWISAALGYKPHYEGYRNLSVMLTINMMVWDRRTLLASSIEGECNQPWPMDRYMMRYMGSSCNFSPQEMKKADSPPMHYLLDKPASWFLETNKITVGERKRINSEFDHHIYCMYMYFYKSYMPPRVFRHLQKKISIIEYFELVSILNQEDFRRLHIVLGSGAIEVDESRISERSSQPVSPVRPILPPDGMCKLCFDGAWRVYRNVVCSGGGYVLYNHDGVVLFREYFPLKSAVDAFDAEVQSLCLGLLDVLKYTDFLDVVVEGDCRELIDGARCTKYVEAAHVESFWKLQSLIPRFKQLRFQFIYREGNRVANCCASIGCYIHSAQQVQSARANYFMNYVKQLEKMNKYIAEDSKQMLHFRVHPDWNSKKMEGENLQMEGEGEN